MARVYVVNVTEGVNDFTKRVHIKDLFEQFGEVAACWLPPVGHRHADYGYVKFKRLQSAEAAVEACRKNQVELWGKRIMAVHRKEACANHDDYDFDARGSNLTSARELFKAELIRKARRPPSSSSSSDSSDAGKKQKRHRKPKDDDRGDRGRGRQNDRGADAIVQRMLEDRGSAAATAAPRKGGGPLQALGDGRTERPENQRGNARRPERPEPYDDRDSGRRPNRRREQDYDAEAPRYERGRGDAGRGEDADYPGGRRRRRGNNGRDDMSPQGRSPRGRSFSPRAVSNSPGRCVSNSPGGAVSNSPGIGSPAREPSPRRNSPGKDVPGRGGAGKDAPSRDAPGRAASNSPGKDSPAKAATTDQYGDPQPGDAAPPLPPDEPRSKERPGETRGDDARDDAGDGAPRKRRRRVRRSEKYGYADGDRERSGSMDDRGNGDREEKAPPQKTISAEEQLKRDLEEHQRKKLAEERRAKRQEEQRRRDDKARIACGGEAAPLLE